ncbi:MAG: NAD(P)-dependent glycerol-3-phosphate dehydrogenase, partial [Verrucomicrobia bacterium]|nr:NAD(P)-dependent glycerol-3-phosphate dehydrogenase [Verrucomicrobiota bacterium]
MNNPDAEIAILGAGGWGTALGVVLASRGRRVLLWGRDPAHVAKLRKTRENAAYLPGIELPKNLAPTADFAHLRGAALVLFVTPSRALRDVAGMLARSGVELSADVPLLSCTKGIEHGTGQRMSEISREFFPQHPIAALSGPSHAEEVARGTPTAVVLGSENAEVAAQLQAIFNGDSLRAYTTDDLAGVELGGALKNVFALAAGVSDGLGLGDNAKAALVTRALAEMIRLGTRLGGRRETFQGLSGIGDLMVTCFSRHS